ncbi:hypothetical protein AB733_17860 [Photobacterium swingsii]|uniref:DUF2063 domain-containing protein n=1 Tax=Photobacterium swingsii TaxID=680026 RepID=A0A0J8V7I2_9GAMM|nr:DNA-binding domain-containing protein [Photobacterium swingsii]KMV29403.1 hypothetical protein AB733_17860 [Photobacterium swingsii]PSW20402.1 DUF2063 domain-containing protein [Photobacterium swingsii]
MDKSPSHDLAPALHQLQQDFSTALHYQPSDVSKHIQVGRFPAEQLIQVYRNNFIISLCEVLEATYPCTLAVIGEECFTQLARQHVLNYPLKQGDVTPYGACFGNTVCTNPSLLEAVPYLIELIQLEWLIDTASQHPCQATDFPFEKLQVLTEDNIAQAQLVVPEHTYLLDANYPVGSIWQMVRHDKVEEIDLNQAESVIVQHHPEQLSVLTTTPAATALVQLSQQQRPLGDANEAMMAILGELLQQNVFSDIQGLPQGDSAC